MVTKYYVNITVIDLTSLDDQHNNTNESVHFVCPFISVICYAKKNSYTTMLTNLSCSLCSIIQIIDD